MFPLVAQLRFDDAPDLACVGNAAAETFAYGCAVAVVHRNAPITVTGANAATSA